MKIKFTESKDGEKRTTVRVQFRLTEQQVKDYLRFAEQSGAGGKDKKDLAYFLKICAFESVDNYYESDDSYDKED